MKAVHLMMVAAQILSFATGDLRATLAVVVVWAVLIYRHYEQKNFAKQIDELKAMK
jgi:hypothetical protein